MHRAVSSRNPLWKMYLSVIIYYLLLINLMASEGLTACYVEIHLPGCASNIVLLPLPPLSPLLTFARRRQLLSENRRAKERFQHRFCLVFRQKKENQNLSCESVCRLWARLLLCVADPYYNQPLYSR